MEKQGIKVYTIKEGYDALKGNDQEVVKDILAKYPQTCLCLVQLINAPGFERFLEGLPAYVTLRKMEDRYRGKFSDTDKEDAAEEEEQEEAVSEAEEETAEEQEEEFGMNPPEDEENPKVDYSTLSAIELYKLCKSRGINTAPRQKTAVYIKLLEKLDAEEISEAKTIKEAEAEEEGWEEDPEEEEEKEEAETPKAPAKKTASKTTTKAASKTSAKKAPAKKSTAKTEKTKSPATKAEAEEDWEW